MKRRQKQSELKDFQDFGGPSDTAAVADEQEMRLAVIMHGTTN